MKRKVFDSDDDMDGTISDLVAEVVMRLDSSIGIVISSMKHILDVNTRLLDCFETPIANLREHLHTISLRLRVNMDFRTPIVAEIIKRSGAKRSFTVALLMEYLEIAWPSLSLRAVYEYLLEDAHGISFDQDVLYSMPDPSMDSEMIGSDIFVCALVVRVNILSCQIGDSRRESGDSRRESGDSWESGDTIIEKQDSDIKVLQSMFLDGALVIGPFFDKLDEMGTIRQNGLESMTRVTPSAFVKAISHGKIHDVLSISDELRELINGLLWPDLLKFIELCHRRYEADTKHPVALEDIMQVDEKETSFKCNHLVESFKQRLTLLDV